MLRTEVYIMDWQKEKNVPLRTETEFTELHFDVSLIDLSPHVGAWRWTGVKFKALQTSEMLPCFVSSRGEDRGELLPATNGTAWRRFREEQLLVRKVRVTGSGAVVRKLTLNIGMDQRRRDAATLGWVASAARCRLSLTWRLDNMSSRSRRSILNFHGN